MPPLLAHGALGWFDEILFAGVALAFIAMMVMSWLRSRGIPMDEHADGQSAPADSADHIRLE